MKELNGKELQGFIKQRQARQVRNLRQEYGVVPKLVIIMSKNASQAIQTYVRMKTRYAADILIDVDVQAVAQADIAAAIDQANNDPAVQGIILQLPIDDVSQTEKLCQLIAPEKDVDGLGTSGVYPSATAQAIDWLLAGYNIELSDKQIAIVGRGKLVGAPLEKMWQQRGLNVQVYDKANPVTADSLRKCNVIVTATGVPHLITSEMVAPETVVVDAGTASEGGVLVGDVDDAVRQRSDITITPQKGGVGPLTYAVLFDHLIEACLRQVGKL
mgnify:FL=1